MCICFPMLFGTPRSRALDVFLCLGRCTGEFSDGGLPIEAFATAEKSEDASEICMSTWVNAQRLAGSSSFSIDDTGFPP